MTDEQKDKYVHSERLARALTFYIREQKTLRCLKYRHIAERLKDEFDIRITAKNLEQRFGSGRFGAQLFICSLYVMGITDFDVSEIKAAYDKDSLDKR